MGSSRFLLQAHVDAVYEAAPRRLAFKARTETEFGAWQAALRGKALELLGLGGRTPPESVAAEKLQAVEREGYVEEKYLLDAGEGVGIPAYLLVPKTEPPYRPVLVFHGHNPSVQWILGNYPSAEERESRLKADNNYAQALAQAGYLVCAVEQRGFGERQTEDGRGGVHENSCRHLAFAYQMAGRNLVGERCWDGMCAIAFLQSRPDVAPGVLGCTGNSGGGTTALWLSAIDERITVSVPGCYLCSFRASIYNLYHCECNYVPGILEWAEMGDLAALIAPRPLRAIAGAQDDIFPIDGVREQFAVAARAYELLGVGERCSLGVHPGPHGYNHRLSHAWFGAWLGGTAVDSG